MLVFLSMLCFNPFDKLYKLIRLCNRKTRFLLFLADNEHHVFFRGALIVQVLNVVMEMPANCVWHTVFEWKTVIFVLMSHYYFYVYSYECSMADFFLLPAVVVVTMKVLGIPVEDNQFISKRKRWIVLWIILADTSKYLMRCINMCYCYGNE